MDFQCFRKTARDWKKCDNLHLSTGCDKIDQLLRGGVPKKGITQIYGEAGTGKTQLALQLALSAQNPNQNNSKNYIIYICTESVFPSRRLQELIKNSPISKKFKISGDFILVEHVSTVEDLENCILNKIANLLSIGTHKIDLIIIDSIAAPYRAEYDEKNLRVRAKSLQTVGQALHSFSQLYNLAVVCINQVSASICSTVGPCQKLQPTCGIIWADQVTHSICLCRHHDYRHFYIQKSPYLPREKLSYKITESGLFGLL